MDSPRDSEKYFSTFSNNAILLKYRGLRFILLTWIGWYFDVPISFSIKLSIKNMAVLAGCERAFVTKARANVRNA